MDKSHPPLIFRSYQFLTFAYLSFIFVASFYLTRSLPNSDTTISRILAISINTFQLDLHNLRDIATNIVLYIPLGMLFCATRSIRKPIAFVNYGLLLGFLISCFVETVQAFIGRYSDLADIVSNSLGFIVGHQIMWWAIYRIRLNLAHLLGISVNDEDSSLRTLTGLRFAYIVTAYFVSLLPLDITVSLSEIYEKMSIIGSNGLPKLILDPFYHFRGVHNMYHSVLLSTLIILPFAVLSAIIRIKSNRSVLAYTAVSCLVFMFTVEISQIFIFSAYSDVFLIIVAPLVGGIIAYLLKSWIKFEGRQYISSSEPSNNQIERINYKNSHTEAWVLMILSYCLFIVFLSWSPFIFEIDISALKQKLLSGSNWIPFKAHFSVRSMGSAIDIVREAFIYVPLGMLMMHLASQYLVHRWALICSCALGLSFAISMEISQLMVKSRFVDITDPLLAGFGSLVGCLLLPLFLRPTTNR